MSSKDRHKPGYIQEFQRTYYDDIRLRVRKDSGLKDAILAAAIKHDMSVNEYIIAAVKDKLEKDA